MSYISAMTRDDYIRYHYSNLWLDIRIHVLCQKIRWMTLMMLIN